MEYPDGCITTVRMCCEKGGHHRRWAYTIEVKKAVLPWRYIPDGWTWHMTFHQTLVITNK